MKHTNGEDKGDRGSGQLDSGFRLSRVKLAYDSKEFCLQRMRTLLACCTGRLHRLCAGLDTKLPTELTDEVRLDHESDMPFHFFMHPPGRFPEAGN